MSILLLHPRTGLGSNPQSQVAIIQICCGSHHPALCAGGDIQILLPRWLSGKASVCQRWSACCLVVSDSLQPYGLLPARLLCPWGFPGKKAGVGCQALLQRIFPTQGLNPHLLHLLHWQGDSLPLTPPGTPMQKGWIHSLGQEDPLGEGKATHSSILAWEIPWTEEPGRLQSIGFKESDMI